MNPTPEDIQKFQHAIEGSLTSLLTSKYPSYMENYWRYRNRIGPQCPICKSAAKTMFLEEFNRKGADFVNRFKESNWHGYE